MVKVEQTSYMKSKRMHSKPASISASLDIRFSITIVYSVSNGCVNILITHTKQVKGVKGGGLANVLFITVPRCNPDS